MHQFQFEVTIQAALPRGLTHYQLWIHAGKDGILVLLENTQRLSLQRYQNVFDFLEILQSLMQNNQLFVPPQYQMPWYLLLK